MSNFSGRWGLPSSGQENTIQRRRDSRRGGGAPCRTRLEGWIRNVAARSPIWGDVDLAAFCRTTGYSREYVTRELADIRRDNPDLAFETKLRCKKSRQWKRCGVIVAERRKLRFDERSLFYDVCGRRLHNYTTLGRDGEKIVPTVNLPERARKPRGRPRHHPRQMDALLEEWHKLVGALAEPLESGRVESVSVNISDKVSVSSPDIDSESNSELCDSPYKEKDSFGIQQKDLYGAGRDVAQWRGWKKTDQRSKGRSRLRKKAFALLQILAGAHWDNCKRRKNRHLVTLEILRRRFQVFVEADKEIAKLSGTSPGVEALMASQIEAEADPRDLAAIFCFKVLKMPFEQVPEYFDSRR